MAGLQSGEGRMMIDSVIWARDRQTDSHVAIANAAPMYCVGLQNTEHKQLAAANTQYKNLHSTVQYPALVTVNHIWQGNRSVSTLQVCVHTG